MENNITSGDCCTDVKVRDLCRQKKPKKYLNIPQLNLENEPQIEAKSNLLVWYESYETRRQFHNDVHCNGSVFASSLFSKM